MSNRMVLIVSGVEVEFHDRQEYKDAHRALAETELDVMDELERIADGKGYNKAEKQAYIEATLGNAEYMVDQMVSKIEVYQQEREQVEHSMEYEQPAISMERS